MSNKLKMTSLVIVTSLLAGCGTTVYRTEAQLYCPPIRTYDPAFNEQLISEIESLPSTSTALEEALSDYIALRDKIRACTIERDK